MKKLTFLAFVLAIGLFAVQPAFAAEEIRSFHSDITVNPNSTITVTETIAVVAEGNEIRRGIYRDFPTRYQDRYGNNYTVGFDIVLVTRDGSPESSRTESLRNGIRTYFGREDYFLPHGEHISAFTYQTTRQLGFFDTHDELYWNVTGQGWVFPILQASATVHLPDGIAIGDIELYGYTGPTDAQGTDFTATINDSGDVSFTTTKPLGAYEGLTIVVGFPKGFVAEPTQKQKLGYFISDNRSLIILGFGTVAVLLFYLISWHRVGRDPKKSTIIPLYEPPQGITPALMRYIYRMKFDNKAFTAKIIELAIKGAFTIEQTGNKGLFSTIKYSLEKSSDTAVQLTAEEGAIVDQLFDTATTLTLENKHYKKIQAARSELKEWLQKQNQSGKYFKTNLPHAAIGGIGSLFVIGLSLGPFANPIALVAAIVLLLSINLIFFKLIKAPTTLGRKIMDEIEGFRWFLSVTETDRLNFHNPPQKTPELFEKFLPHALALDVEQQWAEQFAEVFAKITAAGDQYQPRWYVGAHFYAINIAAFSSSLGTTMNSAVSSAATAAGSSSGGGGGGGAGGGGGGGGGGGW